MRSFLEVAVEWQITSSVCLTVLGIKGVDNTVSDTESRTVDYNAPDKTDHMVHPELFASLCDHFDMYCDLDAFASPHNRLTPLFIARGRTAFPEQVGSDALSFDLGSVNPLTGAQYMVWVHPPWQLIMYTFLHLKARGARGILVVPRFPAEQWYPTVMYDAGVRQVVCFASKGETGVLSQPGAEPHERVFMDLPRADLLALLFDFA